MLRQNSQQTSRSPEKSFSLRSLGAPKFNNEKFVLVFGILYVYFARNVYVLL